MTICLAKTIVQRVVTTKCGATTNMQGASVWHGDVTCPRCLVGVTGPTEAEEYAESIASLAPLTERPQ